MKKIILISVLCMVTLAGMNYPHKTIAIAREMPAEPYLRIANAIAMVETGINDSAYNPKEKAYGRYQIRKPMLKQYVKETGIHYTLNNCFDKKISNRIFMWHATKYRPDQISKISRCWNGGKQGDKKRSTIAYYQKVFAELKEK